MGLKEVANGELVNPQQLRAVCLSTPRAPQAETLIPGDSRERRQQPLPELSPLFSSNKYRADFGAAWFNYGLAQFELQRPKTREHKTSAL